VPLGLVGRVGPFVHTGLLPPVDSLGDAVEPRCYVNVGSVGSISPI